MGRISVYRLVYIKSVSLSLFLSSPSDLPFTIHSSPLLILTLSLPPTLTARRLCVRALAGDIYYFPLLLSLLFRYDFNESGVVTNVPMISHIFKGVPTMAHSSLRAE